MASFIILIMALRQRIAPYYRLPGKIMVHYSVDFLALVVSDSFIATHFMNGVIIINILAQRDCDFIYVNHYVAVLAGES